MRHMLIALLVFCGIVSVGSGQQHEASQTASPIGSCLECESGEGMVGYGIHVPPIPRSTGRYSNQFQQPPYTEVPSCEGGVDQLVENFLKEYDKNPKIDTPRIREWLRKAPEDLGRVFTSKLVNCAVLVQRIPPNADISRIVLTQFVNEQEEACAQWRIEKFEILAMLNFSFCSSFGGGYNSAQRSDDGRTIAVVFRNWSDTNTVMPYLRVFYKLSSK